MGGVTVASKDVDAMEALFCIEEGTATLLNRDGMGVRKLGAILIHESRFCNRK